jgi:hypothetical protein
MEAWHSELLELLQQGDVNNFVFYDSCHTVVVFTGTYGCARVFDDVPSFTLRSVMDKVRELKIPSTSYLGAKLEPDVRQLLQARSFSRPPVATTSGLLATEAGRQPSVIDKDTPEAAELTAHADAEDLSGRAVSVAEHPGVAQVPPDDKDVVDTADKLHHIIDDIPPGWPELDDNQQASFHEMFQRKHDFGALQKKDAASVCEMMRTESWNFYRTSIRRDDQPLK